jgi:peptidoglycan/LPS O-acetylase OafA/YrhL
MSARRILPAAAAVLLVVSVLSAAALAAGEPDISWRLIGGGSPVSWGGVSLSGGVGQGVAGTLEAGGTELCSGFWCAPGWLPWRQPVYLPIVLK